MVGRLNASTGIDWALNRGVHHTGYFPLQGLLRRGCVRHVKLQTTGLVMAQRKSESYRIPVQVGKELIREVAHYDLPLGRYLVLVPKN
jgi:hypothetical protein